VDLAVRHIDVSGGMVRVRAAEQGSDSFLKKNLCYAVDGSVCLSVTFVDHAQSFERSLFGLGA
jgi:hypothetical protein